MLQAKTISNNKNEMVQVALRCRPMNRLEIANGYINVIKINPSRRTVKIYDPKNENMDSYKVFTFDAVFDGKSSQHVIYETMARPLIDAVLSGFNGTVFAYGQSGAGKTYTMEGTASATGILTRTFKDIFDHIAKSSNVQYLVRTSYLEIYQDEIRDLLGKKTGKKYELRESKDSGVYVKDISSFVCKSEKEMNMIVEAGRRKRAIASTNMNDRSSRSHAIITITVEMKDLTGLFEGRVRVGKLNLVDLAGSERQNKSNAEGKTLKEANKINLSLSALGNVISALSENRSHFIPYRDSKLTRILKDSLGGNSKTLMIANIGPASYNYDESLNTLRYASRAKSIRNDPQVNEDPFDTLIRKYQEEIKRLKCQLAERTVLKQFPKLDTYESPSLITLGKYKPLSNPNDSVKLTNSYNFSSQKYLIEDVKSNGTTTEEIDEDVKELRKRIQLMESKLLIGNKDIFEHTGEQEKAIEDQTYEINQSKQREKEMQEFLQKEREAAEEIKGEYYDLEKEIEIKSNKLVKIYQNLQNIRQEIEYMKEEFNADRRDLEITQQEMLKEIKLKFLIMENFIPKDQRRQLLPKLYYDEEMECWQLKPECEPRQMFPKPKSVECNRRPVTLYSTVIRRKANHVFRCEQTEENRKRTFRFKGENILELDLITLPLTTKNYLSLELPPALNTMFQTALKLEEDVDIDASKSSLIMRLPRKKSRRSLESILKIDRQMETSRRTQSAVNLAVYPKARGLVLK